jgi:hypothetical protein
LVVVVVDQAETSVFTRVGEVARVRDVAERPDKLQTAAASVAAGRGRDADACGSAQCRR